MSVLVLSPHRDDAAFSCGLLLAKLAADGVPLGIANVCTVSDYAPYASVAGAPYSVAEITRLRAAEDVAFVQHLRREFACGQDRVCLLDLGWKDAPLRHAIATEDVLAGEEVPAEEIARLAATLRSLAPASVVLVPMALGGHVDHRLARQAAIDAWPAGKLIFYEDLPYACRMSAAELAEQTRRALPWPCERARLQGARSGDKRRMAIGYGSQIAASVADEMEDYGAALGRSERFYGTDAALRVLAALSGGKQMVEDKRL